MSKKSRNLVPLRGGLGGLTPYVPEHLRGKGETNIEKRVEKTGLRMGWIDPDKFNQIVDRVATECLDKNSQRGTVQKGLRTLDQVRRTNAIEKTVEKPPANEIRITWTPFEALESGDDEQSDDNPGTPDTVQTPG